ncbi:MAG: SsrA-binding protein [Enterobacteriaceae bacterium]
MKENIFKIISRNRYPSYKYNFIKYFNAGIVLKGYEVKLIKDNRVDISKSYIKIKNKEIFLINLNINILKNSFFYKENDKNKKLLLNKNEINFILGYKKKHRCIILLHFIYVIKNLIKLKISLSKFNKIINKKEKKKIKEFRNLNKIKYKRGC